jgi:hypothetical protein
MSRIKFPHDLQKIKSSLFLPNPPLIRNKRTTPKARERWQEFNLAVTTWWSCVLFEHGIYDSLDNLGPFLSKLQWSYCKIINVSDELCFAKTLWVFWDFGRFPFF